MDKKCLQWKEKEARRLQQLVDFQILDTEDDMHFDQITRIASALCATPMALITFIDKDRQWFKSKVGIDASETPRDISFCSHGIEQSDIFIIPNADDDERFKDNPLVMGGTLKFYAGAPLITSEKNHLGMICVADNKPRSLTDEQMEMLKLLAKQVMDQLELRNITKVIVKQNKQLKDAEMKLQEQADFLSAVMDNLPVAVFCKDSKKDFSHTIWNKAAAEHFGWSKSQVLGKPIKEVQPAESHWHLIQKLDEETLVRGTASPVIDFTYSVTDKGLRLFKLQVIPMKNASGEFQHVFGVFQDVTEERDTQAAMAHSSRMSSLGEMAAGIAHEINNPLAVIRSKAQSLGDLANANKLTPEVLKASVEKIDATTVRISKIIAGLRKFAREGSNDPFTKTSVKEIIDTAMDLSMWGYKEQGVALTVRGLPSDVDVDCRSVELVQVLVNLLNNARDASVTSVEKWVLFDLSVEDDIIRFKITDSGPGIPQDQQDKIMHPFFTTKPPGKGTGLGLSISRGIVNSHQGKLWLDTSSSQTCFVIEIPRTQTLALKNAS
jgi:PAS domain S-box-containing protein